MPLIDIPNQSAVGVSGCEVTVGVNGNLFLKLQKHQITPHDSLCIFQMSGRHINGFGVARNKI